MQLIKMTGGLGNQMFIYACYLSLRRFYPCLRIDLSTIYSRTEHNGYELARIFQLHPPVISLPLWLKRIMVLLMFREIKERNHAACTELLLGGKHRGNLYIRGYFQSERYFSDIAPQVRESFTFPLDQAQEQSRLMVARIDADPHSVSLHVRRGDYQKTARLQATLGSVCTPQFYRRAVEAALSVDPSATFYIFSDDLAWVRKNLNIPRAVYIDWNRGADSWQDMMLMSRCHHHIVSNSSFSWWGAWLSNHRDGQVFCPDRWWGNDENTDIIPANWVRIATH